MKFLEVLGVTAVKVHSLMELILEVTIVRPSPWVNGCVSPPKDKTATKLMSTSLVFCFF